MRIGELARRLDVSTDTVRFYERAGWLPSAARQDNGYRDYCAGTIDRARLVRSLVAVGLPVRLVRRVLPAVAAGHELDEPTLAELRDYHDRLAARVAQLDRRRESLASFLGQVGGSP